MIERDYILKNLKKKKKRKLGRVWWFMFIILVFWEVKVGGLFEVRSLRLVWLIW